MGSPPALTEARQKEFRIFLKQTLVSFVTRLPECSLLYLQTMNSFLYILWISKYKNQRALSLYQLICSSCRGGHQRPLLGKLLKFCANAVSQHIFKTLPQGSSAMS